MTPFAAQVSAHIERFVQLREALGYAFATQAATLRAFARFVATRHETGPMTQALALAFVLASDVTPRVRARRYGVLRHFADYLAVFDPRTAAFGPYALPSGRGQRPVRILETAELTRLVQAARALSPQHPLRGHTLATMIGLLASTGLRSGEIVRLNRVDVDLARGVLAIHGTKFRKHRYVPVHATTREVLRTYADARDAAFAGTTSLAFFLTRRGLRWSGSGLRDAFRTAATRAGLDRGRPVRPHDLRHRFAVTRLVTWYREGVNVQADLPLLATYLGHARYSDTAYYITGTADLLGLAAARVFGGEP
jgi:integrase